jgi:hypothetical protein
MDLSFRKYIYKHTSCNRAQQRISSDRDPNTYSRIIRKSSLLGSDNISVIFHESKLYTTVVQVLFIYGPRNHLLNNNTYGDLPLPLTKGDLPQQGGLGPVTHGTDWNQELALTQTLTICL